ncbi:F-box only protein 2-like [Mixophyes fleayi]|uniref:F-box only protein 2-like n=1 Tax=Mixophyes fleayi TaxID=3061075 RepID=UPI003F4DD1D4
MAKNLIKNGCGKEEFKFWEDVQNGGDGWNIEVLPGDCGASFPADGVDQYFASSFEWCSKSQTIDLRNEGFPEEVLDNIQPSIVVNDWYAGRTDADCVYQLNVQLLSDSRDVITEYTSDRIAIPQTSEGTWTQISHVFFGYGPGVRFINFKHGGEDNVCWKGWYGVRVTNSSVTLEV